MNITPLYELKDRLDASLTAGVKLMDEDFRLKRAVEQVQPLAEASPVFGKICAMSQSLIAPGGNNRAAMLLDTLALVNAVLTTQGVTGVSGEIAPVELNRGANYRQRPYSVMVPIITALTGKGGGRHSVIAETLQADPDLFSDYRLRQMVVNALGDSYSETAEMISRWLDKNADRSFVPLLKKGLDPAGKREAVRRIELIGKLAGAEENEYHVSLLETAQKDVRIAVINALRYDSANTDLLMGLVKTEKGNCKTAALGALAAMDTPESQAYWSKELAKKPKSCYMYLWNVSREWLSDQLADQLTAFLTKLHAEKRDNLSMAESDTWFQLTYMARGKSSAKMLDFYRTAATMTEFMDLFSYEVDHQPKFIELPFVGYRKGVYSGAAMGYLLLDSLIMNPCPELADLAMELLEKHGETWLPAAFAAAFIHLPAGEVWEKFSPYLTEKPKFLVFKASSQKKTEQQLLLILNMLRFDRQAERYFLHEKILDTNFDAPLKEAPDLHWIEYIMKLGINQKLPWGEDKEVLLMELVDTGNPQLCELMRKYFYELAKVKPDYRYFDLLVKCGQRDFRGLLAAYCKGEQYLSEYYIYGALRMLPMTSQEAGEELKAVAGVLEKRWKNTTAFENLNRNAEWLLAGGNVQFLK